MASRGVPNLDPGTGGWAVGIDMSAWGGDALPQLLESPDIATYGFALGRGPKATDACLYRLHGTWRPRSVYFVNGDDGEGTQILNFRNIY